MGGYGRIELLSLGSNPIIDIGRHAISTEERRCFYRDNLWDESAPTQDFRQVWFSGAHSDVGGSRTTYERVTDLSHLERLIDCRAQNRVFGGTAQIDAYISSVT